MFPLSIHIINEIMLGVHIYTAHNRLNGVSATNKWTIDLQLSTEILAGKIKTQF